MNVLHITVSTLVLMLVAACSTPAGSNAVESKSFDYKAPPVKVRALDVPPDITVYNVDDRFSIPGETESVTRYSEFSKGTTRKPNAVLPPVRNVQLERKDGRRWLLVNDKAENIWPIVKAFWLENGLTLKIENPQVGIMETEWAENRAKVPMDAFRKYFGTVFGGLLSSGESDQYHTRLERSKDGNSTEIYITHYGMQEVAEKDETGFKWIPRPSDPELEATMLQLLMSKLGGGSGILDTSKKPPVEPTAGGIAAPKLIKLADGSQSISLSEPFDKSWRKVGLALDQAKLVVADKDRSKGIYFLGTGKDESKNKLAGDLTKRIQVNVREVGAACEVTVRIGDDGSNENTQKITDTLYKILGRL